MNAPHSPIGRSHTAPSDRSSVSVSPLVGTEVSFTRCPDCGGPFSYRIVDEDTGCRYPVDDGEHYCEPCDALFTDEYLADDTSLTVVERLGPGRIAV